MIEPRCKLVLLLLLAFSLAACSKHAADSGEDKKDEPVPDVTVSKVVRAVIADNLIVNGNLAALPNRDAKVAALVPGRISRVLVVEGDRVTSGESIAELDSTLLREQERQSEAAVTQAKTFRSSSNSSTNFA